MRRIVVERLAVCVPPIRGRRCCLCRPIPLRGDRRSLAPAQRGRAMGCLKGRERMDERSDHRGVVGGGCRGTRRSRRSRPGGGGERCEGRGAQRGKGRIHTSVFLSQTRHQSMSMAAMSMGGRGTFSRGVQVKRYIISQVPLVPLFWDLRSSLCPFWEVCNCSA